ncbi:MAG: hypothetical protein GX823_02510, partial [Clostridiales bacterium]|nr:hypothetical protein [Clostridiales bacterium]
MEKHDFDFIETEHNKVECFGGRRQYSWESPPPPIPEDQIAETIEADIAVIGGGIAGLGIGARAVE